MAYICAKCKRKQKQADSSVRCSYCGSRMIVKSRPNLSREVKTD